MRVIMLFAIACLRGTPRRVRMGITIVPPPKPMSEPKKPANIDVNMTVMASKHMELESQVSWTIFILFVLD